MYKTYLALPLLPKSSLKKLFPKAKIYLVKKEEELFQVKFNLELTVIKFRLPIPHLARTLINLERMFETELKKRKVSLILVFEQNLKADRLSQNLESYFLKRVSYLPISKEHKSVIKKQPQKFFNLLSEFQQPILQQIVLGNFKDYFYQKSEIDYLLKTNLISLNKGNYELIIFQLKNYLKNLLPSLSFPLEFKNERIFYKKKDINSYFTFPQKKGLLLLAKNKGKIINRNRLAEELWGKDFIYSDYALDQFVCRLRKKLRNFNLDSFLICIKKQGFIFNLKPIKPKVFKRGKLVFKPFIPDKNLLKFYFQVFKNPLLRSQLFKYTYKSKDQIEVWLNNLIQNPCFSYFLILLNNRPIGHIGLKNMNPLNKSAFIGAFLKKEKYLKKYGKEIYQFIIDQAEEKGLKRLSKDISQYSNITAFILNNLRFTQTSFSLWHRGVKGLTPLR